MSASLCSCGILAHSSVSTAPAATQLSLMRARSKANWRVRPVASAPKSAMMDQPPGTGRSAIEPVVKVMEEVLDLLRYFEPTLAVRRAAKGADVALRVDSFQADLGKRRGG